MFQAVRLAPSDDWNQRWKKARKDVGYTSAQKLAQEIGAHRLTATAWETGKSRPEPKYREALAALDVRFAELITELPEAPPSRADLQGRVADLERRLLAAEAKLAEVFHRVAGLLEPQADQVPAADEQKPLRGQTPRKRAVS